MPYVLPASNAPWRKLRHLNKEHLMSDDKTRMAEEPSVVNIHESYTARNWARAFGCTLEVLKEAVKTVGPSADSVRRYLAQR
jgi:hypothetical protein